MKLRFIRNGYLVLPSGLHEGKTLVIDGKHIIDTDFRGEIPDESEVIDANNGYILPGFVDIHLHGGGGFDFMDANPQDFENIALAHCKHGTTSFVPTTVTDSKENLQKVFTAYRAANKNTGADFLGLHLEGPYIAREMKGAHREEFIRFPIKKEVDELLEQAGDIIIRCSCAPEMEGVSYLAEKMRERGIILSVAHSNAICREIIDAHSNGFSLITHLYSLTPSVRKINQMMEAGIVEAAYLLDDMFVELIGDGKHVPKELMQMVVKLKGCDRVVLITDAMRAAGTDDSESWLGSREGGHRVIVEDGVAKLPDRTFYAGSIATSDKVFKNAVVNYGFSIPVVSEMMSLTPAKAIGIEKTKGSLTVGKDADIVILDTEFTVKYVLVRGQNKLK